MKKTLHYLKCVFLLTAIIATQIGNAQSTDASARGTITGDSSKPLAGATVTIVNNATGFKSTALTNAAGNYSFRQLPLGNPYSLQVSFVGYITQAKTNLALNLGDELVNDFVLVESNSTLSEVVVTSGSVSSRIDRFGASTAISARTITDTGPEQELQRPCLAVSTCQRVNLGGQRYTSQLFN
jgi:hypothetical protein